MKFEQLWSAYPFWFYFIGDILGMTVGMRTGVVLIYLFGCGPNVEIGSMGLVFEAFT